MTRVRARARPGHAHSLWLDLRRAGELQRRGCGEDDIFIDPDDHSAGFNAEQIVATRASSVWGKAGAIANPAGRLKLNGALGRGRSPMARTLT